MSDLVSIARLFLYVREAQDLGQNRGLRVEAIQKWSGGATGDSWCLEMLWLWLDILFQGQSPVPRMQACQDLYEMGREQHWIVDTPQPGDVFVYVNEADHAHHTGVITVAEPLTGVAGNTSADGASSNGDRVAEHYLVVRPERIKFIRIPGA
jgi:hypothetical protein